MTRERVYRAVILTLGLLCWARGGAAVENRAEWMYQAHWGVFIHYLAKSPDLSVAEWNRLVDGFAVEGLVDQLESARAGYLIITIGKTRPLIWRGKHELYSTNFYFASRGVYSGSGSTRPDCGSGEAGFAARFCDHGVGEFAVGPGATCRYERSGTERLRVLPSGRPRASKSSRAGLLCGRSACE